MKDRIWEAMKFELEATAAPGDLSYVLKRGKVLRRRHRFLMTLGTAGSLLLMSFVIWGVRNEFAGPRQGSNSLTSSTNSPEASVDSEDTTAASFAIEAVEAANLNHPPGRHFDYSGVTRTSEGWIVDFSAGRCELTDRWSCEGSLTATVGVERRGSDLVVSDVGGGFSQEEEDLLVGYLSSAAQSPSTRAVFTNPEILSQGTERLLYASMYWIGSIEASKGYEADCVVRAENAAGQVVHKSRSYTIASPAFEEARDSIFLAELPARESIAKAEVSCGEWSPKDP